jgi:hypothetical protein
VKKSKGKEVKRREAQLKDGGEKDYLEKV